MSERVLEFLARPDVWAAVVGLVGFLALTWLIRQAPLGQATRPEPAGAPSAARRDRAVILAVVGFLRSCSAGSSPSRSASRRRSPRSPAGSAWSSGSCGPTEPSPRQPDDPPPGRLRRDRAHGVAARWGLARRQRPGLPPRRAADRPDARPGVHPVDPDAQPAPDARPPGDPDGLLRQLRAVGPPARPGPPAGRPLPRRQPGQGPGRVPQPVHRRQGVRGAGPARPRRGGIGERRDRGRPTAKGPTPPAPCSGPATCSSGPRRARAPTGSPRRFAARTSSPRP